MTDRQTADKEPGAFRTISEVAEYLDVPQHVLRFWETRFNQIRPLKRGGGRRFYRPEDVLLISGIRHLLYGEGYTIKGVQRILKEEGVRFVQQVGAGESAGAPVASAQARTPAQDEGQYLDQDQYAGRYPDQEQGMATDSADDVGMRHMPDVQSGAVRPQAYAAAITGDERVASPPVANWAPAGAPVQGAALDAGPSDQVQQEHACHDPTRQEDLLRQERLLQHERLLQQEGLHREYASPQYAPQEYASDPQDFGVYADSMNAPARGEHAGPGAMTASQLGAAGYPPAQAASPPPDYGAAYDLAEAKRERGHGELAAHAAVLSVNQLSGAVGASAQHGPLYYEGGQEGAQPSTPRLAPSERAQLQAALRELLECRRLLAHARGDLDEPG